MNIRFLTAVMVIAAGFAVLWQPENQQREKQASPSVRQESVVTQNGEADEAIMEKRKQVNAELARQASFEMVREINDADFKIREPRYRELFSRWKITEADIQQVLEIILNRQRQQGVVFVTYLKEEGRAGAGKELTMATQIEDALAEQQLVRLLGANRYRELSRLDAILDSERDAKARMSED